MTSDPNIDHRTGEVFPSTLLQAAQDALLDLPMQLDVTSWEHRTAQTLGAKLGDLWSTKIAWTLELDPNTLRHDYGAFQELDRSAEWFIAAGDYIKDEMTGDEALWQAINAIFDRAILATDESVSGWINTDTTKETT